MAKPVHEPRTFEEFLKQRKKEDEDLDWGAVLRLWSQQAEELIDLVAGWLRPLEVKGLVRMERGSWQLNEAEFGTYGLPGLKLSFPKSPLIVLRPVGKQIIGAAGRYDLECGPEKFNILLSGKGKWRIAHTSRRQRPIPLDRGAFESAVQELVSR